MSRRGGHREWMDQRSFRPFLIGLAGIPIMLLWLLLRGLLRWLGILPPPADEGETEERNP